MANSLNSINTDIIANESLATLESELPRLSAFAHDFSDEISAKGQSVSTRMAHSVTANDASSGYTAQDADTTGYTLTLNNHKAYVAAFSDLELAKAGSMDMLINTFGKVAIHACVDAVVQDALALITAANYSNGTVVAASAFDADAVADASGALSTRKVPKGNRSLLVNPSYFAALAKDDYLSSALHYNSASAIRDGEVPRVHGFQIVEFSDLPANSEDLGAVALSPDALIACARIPSAPNGGVQQTVVSEPSSGFPIAFRSWYSPDEGKWKIAATVLYAVGLGVTDNLQRITAS